MDDITNFIEQEDIYSEDIISLSHSSAFVRNYDLDGENYTLLLYDAVLLYSEDQ